MSRTPDRPSTGLGNIWPRVVVWARLDSELGKVLMFATHVDHRCVSAMINICREQFDELTDPDAPQILAGDLNLNPLHGSYQSLLSDGWSDAYGTASNDSPTFLYDVPELPSGRIDHVFFRGSRLCATKWSRLLPPEGRPPVSDHHPVYARLRLE